MCDSTDASWHLWCHVPQSGFPFVHLTQRRPIEMFIETDAHGEMFHEYQLLFIFVSNYKTFKQVLLLNTEISPLKK